MCCLVLYVLIPYLQVNINVHFSKRNIKPSYSLCPVISKCCRLCRPVSNSSCGLYSICCSLVVAATSTLSSHVEMQSSVWATVKAKTWLWTAAFISGPLGKWTRLDKIIGVMLSSLNVTGQVQTGGYAASLPHESLTPCPSGPWAEITLFCYSEETLTSRSWNRQDYLRLS